MLFPFVSYVVALVILIAAVELVIKWNHIQGVNQMGSTGQILRFVVAVGSLIGVAGEYLLHIMHVRDNVELDIDVDTVTT